MSWSDLVQKDIDASVADGPEVTSEHLESAAEVIGADDFAVQDFVDNCDPDLFHRIMREVYNTHTKEFEQYHAAWIEDKAAEFAEASHDR